MKSRIFLDYASTTPLDSVVLKAMTPYYKKYFGNPSSAHSFGQKTKAAIEEARARVSKFLECAPLEVFFTSGATEANTSVIHGVVEACEEKKPGLKPHIVVSAIEHESVLAPIRRLELAQRVEATYVSPGRDGIVSASDVARAVRSHTALVSVMYVNSEVGTVQPVAEIGGMLVKRPPSVFGFKTIFHTDAVQAAYWLECSPAALKADFLTLSAHKIYGPKGVGVLYKKEGVPFVPLLRGGGQEYAMRSGTENVAGIVGCGEAVRYLFDPKISVARIRIRQVRDRIIRGVLKRIGGASLTGALDGRVFNNAHFLLEGVDGRDLALALDREGFAVSTGSACSENTREASHVLIAMGVAPQDALGALRVTVGKQTKAEDADKFIGTLAAVLKRARIKQ
ncbi:MAG: cysteine desulfurase [Candidatus Wildermuthbacteria bacterium]|nr:cysteine desulfurase [Candidatus Wildermuthbacteria bacterium]MBI2647799.1 cysteine desulfurase [Candidatus Wildermuthbacteria bacterium]